MLLQVKLWHLGWGITLMIWSQAGGRRSKQSLMDKKDKFLFILKQDNGQRPVKRQQIHMDTQIRKEISTETLTAEILTEVRQAQHHIRQHKLMDIILSVCFGLTKVVQFIAGRGKGYKKNAKTFFEKGLDK